MYHNKKVFEKIISKTKIYLAIIAILMVVLCMYNIKFIIPSILIYILIIIYAYWTNNKGKEELSEHIKNLTFSLDKVAKIALVNLPFPLVIAETNGNLIFRNTRFNEEFANIDINNYLKEILKDVKAEIKNSDKKEKIVDELQIDKKTYKIYGEYMPLKDEYVITIYFIDNTKLVNLEKKIDDTDSYIGLIKVDNYDELAQRITDEEKPQILAKIEKKIYDWATEFDGLILKSDRDTFIAIFEKQNLKRIEEKKFDILDVIKEEVIPKYVSDQPETGIISPYKNQVYALNEEIKGMDIATVHKFQGREKDTIIISTVDDTISEFTDKPDLINVAVSRAKKKLILVVTGNELTNESNIKDLMNYIEYNNFEIYDSKVYSIFDYLYKQYADERKEFLKKHKSISDYDSENLMYVNIEKIFKMEKYSALDVITHIPLKQIIRNYQQLSNKEIRYLSNPATHVDFLIYNRISKKVVLVIEVDGVDYHTAGTKQAERDMLKNHILELAGLSYIRTKTNGSMEKERIMAKLDMLI